MARKHLDNTTPASEESKPVLDAETEAPPAAVTAAAESKPAAKVEASASQVGLASRIKKQGKRVEGMPAISRPVGEAGLYEVIHGRINFGYDAHGDAVIAEKGAVVELTPEEAGRMLREGTVKKAS